MSPTEYRKKSADLAKDTNGEEDLPFIDVHPGSMTLY
jgi:hypothetical protein